MARRHQGWGIIRCPALFAVLLAVAFLRAAPVVAAGVVGTGTPQSCTEGALDAGGATRARPRVKKHLAALAVPFVANTGQSPAPVAYYASTFSGTVFVTCEGQVVYSLPAPRLSGRATPASMRAGWSITESFVGGHATPAAAEPAPTNVSVFLGDKPERWRAHVPTAAAVALGQVYPGITVTLKASGKRVEKVFTVEPGAAPSAIRVHVAGAGLAMDADGALALRTGTGAVRLTRPAAYQDVGGRRTSVPVAYEVAGDTYGFRVGRYDAKRPLVIDPLLQATYLGGSGSDLAFAIARNATTGEVYVAGASFSADFPGTSGGAQSMRNGDVDAFVARFNANLTVLDQATYLGGSEWEEIRALALDATTGEVYVAGMTGSVDFPGTSGGAQALFGGGGRDGFVARLNIDLTVLDQATYLGGSGIRSEGVHGLALNATTGEAYVTGSTVSNDFPGTGGGAQSTMGGGPSDMYVARLNAALTALDQATYLGGNGEDLAEAVALNAATGEVYVTGATGSTDFPGTSGGAQSAFGGGSLDAVVARLNADLTAIDQVTYLGGTSDDSANAVLFNAAIGAVYVTGGTGSADFPGTSGGAQSTFAGGSDDGFVARLNANLTALDQATYLGGSGSGVDFSTALALDATTGGLYVAGLTESTDFPGTAGGAQSMFGGGSDDGFVARLNANLTALDQATYLGGSGGSDLALALDTTADEVYVAGRTDSTDFPGTSGGAQDTFNGGLQDAFLARLSVDLAAPAPPSPTPTQTHTPTATQTSTPTPTWTSTSTASPTNTQPVGAGAVQNLIIDVTALGLPPGTTTALTSTLAAALNRINADNTVTACNQLNAFFRQVSAQQRAGRLSAPQADALTAAVKQIEAQLGCERKRIGLLGPVHT